MNCEETERGTEVYTKPVSTKQVASAVEFGKRSNYSLQQFGNSNYILVHQTLITSSNTEINYKSELSSSYLYEITIVISQKCPQYVRNIVGIIV